MHSSRTWLFIKDLLVWFFNWQVYHATLLVCLIHIYPYISIYTYISKNHSPEDSPSSYRIAVSLHSQKRITHHTDILLTFDNFRAQVSVWVKANKQKTWDLKKNERETITVNNNFVVKNEKIKAFFGTCTPTTIWSLEQHTFHGDT